MKLLFKKIITFILFIVILEQCSSLQRSDKQLDVNEIKSYDSIKVLVNESVESLFIHYLRYPKSKEELVNFILKGDSSSIKYYNKLIKYKPNIIFVDKPSQNYLKVKFKKKTLNIPKYNICESLNDSLPSIILFNRVVFYRDGSYIFDKIEEKKLTSSFYFHLKSARDKLLKDKKLLQYKYFKYSKNGLTF